MNTNTSSSTVLSTVLTTIEGAIATVTLNRPQVRNAFNDESIAALTQTFIDLGNNAAVRCIVLAAHGSAFCAGADLNWMRRMANYSLEENVADAMNLATMLNTIYTCPKPVVAKVQGACFAGGVGLVAACDAAFASDEATFCLSEVRLGLIPATISPYVIAAMGARAAQRYFVSAQVFSAQQAAHYGLLSEVCSDTASLDAQVNAFAAQCASNAPKAMEKAKRLVQDYAGQRIDSALIKNSAQTIATVRASTEAKEGIRAFLDKQTS